MANANGKVSDLPIQISDCKAAMAHNSNDLGTLCKSDTVNLYAKYKPLKFTSGNTEPPAIQCNNSGFTDYFKELWKGDVREEGNKNSGYTYENGCKIPTLFQGNYSGSTDVTQYPGSGGIQYPYLFTFVAQGPTVSGESSRSTWDNVFSRDWTTKKWDRDKPNVYRLSDFARYDNNNNELFTINWPDNVTLNANQKAFEIRGRVNNRDNEDGLTPADYTNIKNLCLKIGNYEVRNTFSGNNTIDFYVQKPVWSGKTSISPKLYIRGVDKNSKAKYMGCKFLTNSVVEKTIPITILGNQYKLCCEFGYISPAIGGTAGMYTTTASPIQNMSFFRSVTSYDDEYGKSQCLRALRLDNYYWKCHLLEATGAAQAARPTQNITFQCILQDELHDDFQSCVAPSVILGEFTTNYNPIYGEENYQGYWYYTDSFGTTDGHSGDESKVRFLDDRNTSIYDLGESANKYMPILREDPNHARYDNPVENVAVRLRVRFRVLVNGTDFGTLDVPINGDGHSYGYIWDNTPKPSNRNSQLTAMDGGFNVQVNGSAITVTSTTLVASEHGGAVQIRDGGNPVAATNIVRYCTEELGQPNYFQKAFVGDDDYEDFVGMVETDTTQQEINYIDWSLE